jgi:hypothetical protein
MTMGDPDRPRLAPLAILLVLWTIVLVFVVNVGFDSARGLARPAPPSRSWESISVALGMATALAITFYGLVVAAVLLGLTWLAVPPARRRSVAWLLVPWTALIAAFWTIPRLVGWPLLLITVAFSGIALAALRALVVTLLELLRDPIAARSGA